MNVTSDKVFIYKAVFLIKIGPFIRQVCKNADL